MRCARRRAWGPEPPSGSAAHLTARAFSRGNLESARATGLSGEVWSAFVRSGFMRLRSDLAVAYVDTWHAEAGG